MSVRKLTDAKKKNIAGKQFFKCANKPNSGIVPNYTCPLWERNGDKQGCFDESGYDIDHIMEHSLTQNDLSTNLQALCKPCHIVKTKRFMIKDTDNVEIQNNDANILNNLLLTQLQQLAKILLISPNGVKQKLIDKLIKKETLTNIENKINTIKDKKYFIRFENSNFDVCHQIHTNENLIEQYEFSISNKYNDVNCDICKTKCTMYFYINLFYDSKTKSQPTPIIDTKTIVAKNKKCSINKTNPIVDNNNTSNNTPTLTYNYIPKTEQEKYVWNTRTDEERYCYNVMMSKLHEKAKIEDNTNMAIASRQKELHKQKECTSKYP
jgi:hypothetical protein